jgi:hypothetical protein
LVADDWTVVPGSSVDHVVATVASDETYARENAVVADQERVISGAARNGVVATISGHQVFGVAISDGLEVVTRAEVDRVVFRPCR